MIRTVALVLNLTLSGAALGAEFYKVQVTRKSETYTRS